MNTLHMTALAGDLPGLRDAVESGIDINSVELAHGNTPLMLAAYSNHPALVAWLIARGAAIDARCKESNTALMKAAWSGATACVAALIEAGADVNAVEREGMTALMIASFHGRYDAVKLLIDAGADVHHRDLDYFTALRNARDQGHKRVVALLEKAALAGDVRQSQEELAETSTNFDLEDVKPFLIQVAERLEGGFTTDTARDLGLEIESLAHDDERMWMFRVVYEGAEMPLHIGVFRDDISQADLSFHALPRLVAMIEELFDREAD